MVFADFGIAWRVIIMQTRQANLVASLKAKNRLK